MSDKPPKVGSKCRKCKNLYNSYKGKSSCYYDEKKSKNLTKKSCASFKQGYPFAPRVDGKLAKAIPFDPTKPASFVFYEDDDKMLLVSWSLDHQKQGSWKLRMIGVEPEGGLALKNFSEDDLRPAFYGTIRVVGPQDSDLFTSSNYEDDDILDEEGNVVNKASEVIISSVRDRKKPKRGR